MMLWKGTAARAVAALLLMAALPWPIGCRSVEEAPPVAEHPPPVAQPLSDADGEKAPKPIAEKPVPIGNVQVYREQGYAEAPAEICLRAGVLDFLAVAPESGKEYESLFRLHCRPSSLHAALLALGARPGRIPEAFRFQRDGGMAPEEAARPVGDRIRIRVVRHEADGSAVTMPMELLVTDRATQRSPARLEWIFTGSFFAPSPDGDGDAYVADLERLAVSMLHHSACVLNVASDAGSPYRGADKGYEINESGLPPEGARLSLRFVVEEE